MRKDVILTSNAGMAVLTLSRPPANLIDGGLVDALGGAVDRAVEDKDARVVVVTGGESVFSEGLDLESLMKKDSGRRVAFVKKAQGVLWRLEHAPKPTIAAIAGSALGMGLELALACDMRLASEDSRLGHPEVTLGLIPAFGGIRRLERLIGRSRSRALILTGEPIPAWEALEIGLVGKVVPRDAVLEEARLAAGRIASQPAGAVRAAKLAMLEAEGKGERTALNAAARLVEQLLAQKE